mmetsp:Transcript_8082/g.22965  ORF Transcript_8082/g.22965 Transcript_8082/m.22965 type:complete len:407 (-) Transcript_8082:832-2052(-)
MNVCMYVLINRLMCVSFTHPNSAVRPTSPSLLLPLPHVGVAHQLVGLILGRQEAQLAEVTEFLGVFLHCGLVRIAALSDREGVGLEVVVLKHHKVSLLPEGQIIDRVLAIDGPFLLIAHAIALGESAEDDDFGAGVVRRALRDVRAPEEAIERQSAVEVKDEPRSAVCVVAFSLNGVGNEIGSRAGTEASCFVVVIIAVLDHDNVAIADRLLWAEIIILGPRATAEFGVAETDVPKAVVIGVEYELIASDVEIEESVLQATAPRNGRLLLQRVLEEDDLVMAPASRDKVRVRPQVDHVIASPRAEEVGMVRSKHDVVALIANTNTGEQKVASFVVFEVPIGAPDEPKDDSTLHKINTEGCERPAPPLIDGVCYHGCSNGHLSAQRVALLRRAGRDIPPDNILAGRR